MSAVPPRGGQNHCVRHACFLTLGVIAGDDIFRKVLTGDDIG
jgi:hypothetical protein